MKKIRVNIKLKKEKKRRTGIFDPKTGLVKTIKGKHSPFDIEEMKESKLDY